MNATDKVEIKLNQSLWALIIAFTALGAAEYFKLSQLLQSLGLIFLIFIIICNITAFIAYTYNYVLNKFNK